MAIVYLALGSNLGDRRQFMDKAVNLLKKQGIKVIRSSAIIETTAVGGPKQGKFLNAVVKVKTDLSPLDLHDATRAIERALGRIKNVVNGPRVIDIDILLYDDIKLVSRGLVIPHPRMLARPFVLKPLQEIDPAVCASLHP